ILIELDDQNAANGFQVDPWAWCVSKDHRLFLRWAGGMWTRPRSTAQDFLHVAYLICRLRQPMKQGLFIRIPARSASKGAYLGGWHALSLRRAWWRWARPSKTQGVPPNRVDEITLRMTVLIIDHLKQRVWC